MSSTRGLKALSCLALAVFAVSVLPACHAAGARADSGAPVALAPASAGAVAAVRAVRAKAPFGSSLPDSELDNRLASLLQWVERAYDQSGALHLLPDAPDAVNGRGATNARLQTLRQTYWLQDNALYGAGALKEYAPALGAGLEASWRAKWEQYFGRLCPDTQSDYVVGRAPDYDRVATPADPRCRLPRPQAWQYFRMNQYPKPADADFDTLPRPIIGADHPTDESGQTRFVPIKPTAVRDLLKYGCLRQVMLGDRGAARKMFSLALAQWDGDGFTNPKNAGSPDAKLKGVYWTRDLALALMCANALGQGGEVTWPQNVSKAAIEQKLWSAQSSNGGIWTNYCTATACPDGPIPAAAKQTNEIAPLVLLAYGPNIWAPR